MNKEFAEKWLNKLKEFCCISQILFSQFSPLITFQKEVFIVFGPFYFLCREAFLASERT